MDQAKAHDVRQASVHSAVSTDVEARSLSTAGRMAGVANSGASTIAKQSAPTGVLSRALPPEPVVILDHKPSIRHALRDAWAHRGTLIPLGAGMLRVQYRYTVLGLWWIPIVVLFNTIGRTVIFGGIFNLPSPHGVPYFLFILTGSLAWTIFDRSLILGLRGFQRFSRLTKELTFPLLLVPIAVTAQALYLYGFQLLLLLGALVYYSIDMHTVIPGFSIVLAPIALLWCLLLAWGIGFFTAPIYARARDIRFILRFVLPFWMYVTPVVYPLNQIGGKFRLVAFLNPLAAPVELFKFSIFGQGVVTAPLLLWSAFATLTVLLAGLWFLDRFGRRLIGIAGGLDREDDVEGLG